MAPIRISPPPTNVPHGLSKAQLQRYKDEGYLIVPGYLSQNEVAGLLKETHDMLHSFDLSTHPMTRFSTGDSQGNKHVGDDYFLTSGDKVRFFFEEDAFSSSGELLKPKEKAINKIGHALHELNPKFHDATLKPRAGEIARQVGFKDPRCLQSMVICKQPEIGGAVPSHQDSTFLYTNRPSAMGFWIALEDATKENGCLSFAKGSHKRARVTKRFVRVPEGGTGFESIPVGEGSWPRGEDPEIENTSEDYDESGEVFDLGEVKAGDLVLIHGNLLHKSEQNTSQKGRIIYTFHVIEGLEEYDARNWLLKPAEGFTRLV